MKGDPFYYMRPGRYPLDRSQTTFYPAAKDGLVFLRFVRVYNSRLNFSVHVSDAAPSSLNFVYRSVTRSDGDSSDCRLICGEMRIFSAGKYYLLIYIWCLVARITRGVGDCYRNPRGVIRIIVPLIKVISVCGMFLEEITVR